MLAGYVSLSFFVQPSASTRRSFLGFNSEGVVQFAGGGGGGGRNKDGRTGVGSRGGKNRLKNR